MPLETEDEDDVFVENMNTYLILFMGSLSMFTSVVLLVYSGIAVFYGQQFLVNFLYTSMVSAFLFGIGFGALLLFRKRRELRKKKMSSFFLASRP